MGILFGSISSVPDTSFALIALSKARGVIGGNASRRVKIENSIVKGVIYLERTFNGNGWGYLKGMPTDYRSTLLASAALVMLGKDRDYVRDAYRTIKSKLPNDPFSLYLWAIVTKNITGEVPSSVIEKLKEFHRDEGELAAATYSLLELEGLTFETALMLSELEDYRSEWTNMYYPIYSTMAFSIVSEKIIKAGEDKLLKLCSILPELQNEDGGWGLYKDSYSDVIVTYHVLNSLRICNPRSDAARKGLNFMRNKMKEAEREIRSDKYLRKEYLYALLSLIEYNNLSKEERENAISLIMSSKWENSIGKQPNIVALAIRALIGLGVPQSNERIREGLEWVMEKEVDGGWGFIFKTPLVEWYFAPTYLHTFEVFNALLPILGKEKLKDTIEFLKKNEPDIEWQKLYVYVTLMKLGEKPEWSISIPNDYYSSPIVDAMLIEYYAISPEVPKVNIYTILSEFKNGKVEIRSDNAKLAIIVSKNLEATLNSTTKIRITELLSIPDTGNYVIIGPVGRIDVSKYNGDVGISLKLGKFTVCGVPLTGDGNLVIIPGRNRKGALLLILYRGRNTDKIAELILQPKLLKYFHGKAVIAEWKDRNRNGRVESDELMVKFL